VHDLLEKALIVHVSAALVEKTVASHHALAWHELEKAMACEAHAASHHALARYEVEKVVGCEARAVSHHALARYEVEKVVGCEAHAVSHHALTRCKLEKAVACGGEDLGKNVASLECGHHEPVNIPPRPQQLSPNVHHSELANKQSIQCSFCAKG
jgi:hypothetical protein